MGQPNSLKQRTDKRFKHLIGTRIQCVDKTGKTRMGILEFAGINTMFHGQFQVTIDRCPIWPINPDTIKAVICQ